MNGERLVAGRYRLVEQIGSGGMSVVWRAVDQELGRTVAIKQTRSHDPDGRSRRREARLAAGVSHPNVVTFFDLVTDDDPDTPAGACGAGLWLVLEYVPSRSLAEVLRTDGPLPVRTVLEYGLQLAGALEAVHATGIVHRDVKPGNVLIGEHGVAKLTDFGISRSVLAEDTVIEAAVVGGTPGYLAPEVANGHDPTPASDVFSFGATLFAAVEGAAPFGSDNPFAALRRASACAVPELVRAGELAPVLARLMRVSPAERPTAAEAARLLRDCAAGDSVPPAGARGGRRAGHAALAVGAALIAVTVVGLPHLPTDGGEPVRREARPAALPAVRPETVPGAGDVRSADPCALLRPDSMRGFGRVDLDPDYGNFNRCDLLVDRDAAPALELKLELENQPPADRPAQGPRVRSGGFEVLRDPGGGDDCTRTILLSDRHQVSITASERDTGSARSTGQAPGFDFCSAADLAVADAVSVLGNGGIPRRSAPPPAASLSTRDVCALLDEGSLRRAAGLNAPEIEAGYGNWECRWDGPAEAARKTTVRVLFDRGPRPSAEDGRRVTVAGREAYLLADDFAENTCQAKLNYRPYTTTNGDEAAELVLVVVFGDPPSARLCGPAAELAGTVAGRLSR